MALFALVAAAIVGFWWWLGAPVAMPPAPLAPGEKINCVSYGPFRGSQTPLDPTTQIDPRQIEEDMVRLARLTDCVRTYSTFNGLDRVPEIAERHGISVMQGLWLGDDRELNRRETASVIALAQRFPRVIRSIVVGNEVLLRGELGPADLIAVLRQVKAAVSMPVTYADVWEFWLRYREVADAVDFVTIHILPYWEDMPLRHTLTSSHVDSIRKRVADAFPGKEIMIGEVGWPSAGRMREEGVPSRANQARVIHDLLALAKRENLRINLIEAFDQPWKRAQEGTVGGHWGLLDGNTRDFKFAWGMPVSNHPQWRLQAAAGIALAALVFGAAVFARRREPAEREQGIVWLGVAAIALPAGALVGWTAENVPLESLGLGGWLRSLSMAGLAVAAPLTCAAALVRGTATASIARVLGPAAERPRDRLALVLALLFIALCVVALQVALGLVFQPRYRDFPFAPLTAAVVPFAVVAFARQRRPTGPGIAETAISSILFASATYILLDETFGNWQADWIYAVLIVLVMTLLRWRDAPG